MHDDKVIVDLVLDSLRELAYPHERERLWLPSGGPDMSSFDECVCQLFDDSGLGIALDKGPVFDPSVDATLAALERILKGINGQRDPREVMSDPALAHAQELATSALSKLTGTNES